MSDTQDNTIVEIGAPIDYYVQLNQVDKSSVRFIVQTTLAYASGSESPTFFLGIGVTFTPAAISTASSAVSPERIIKISQLVFSTASSTAQTLSPVERGFSIVETTRDLQEGKLLDVMDEMAAFTPNPDNLRDTRKEFWSNNVAANVGGPQKIDRFILNTMSYRYPKFRTNTIQETVVRKDEQRPRNTAGYIIDQ